MIEESTAHNIPGYEPLETNINERSTSFSFSLQIVTREGLSVRGDITMQKTIVPQRASRPVQQQPLDIEEYDDESVVCTPRSAIRWKATETHTQTASKGNRVTGNTRIGLLVLLVACIAFFVSGIHAPMLAGNVITIHIPLVWLIALLSIGVIVVSFLKQR